MLYTRPLPFYRTDPACRGYTSRVHLEAKCFWKMAENRGI